MTMIPPDVFDLLGAILVSLISGFVAISRRIIHGQKASLLWVTSEFLSAILSGYLMYTAYPYLIDFVPKWFTLPVAIALAAHIGGRVLQEVEHNFEKLLPLLIKKDK